MNSEMKTIELLTAPAKELKRILWTKPSKPRDKTNWDKFYIGDMRAKLYVKEREMIKRRKKKEKVPIELLDLVYETRLFLRARILDVWSKHKRLMRFNVTFDGVRIQDIMNERGRLILQVAKKYETAKTKEKKWLRENPDVTEAEKRKQHYQYISSMKHWERAIKAELDKRSASRRLAGWSSSIHRNSKTSADKLKQEVSKLIKNLPKKRPIIPKTPGSPTGSTVHTYHLRSRSSKKKKKKKKKLATRPKMESTPQPPPLEYPQPQLSDQYQLIHPPQANGRSHITCLSDITLPPPAPASPLIPPSSATCFPLSHAMAPLQAHLNLASPTFAEPLHTLSPPNSSSLSRSMSDSSLPDADIQLTLRNLAACTASAQQSSGSSPGLMINSNKKSSTARRRKRKRESSIEGSDPKSSNSACKPRLRLVGSVGAPSTRTDPEISGLFYPANFLPFKKPSKPLSDWTEAEVIGWLQTFYFGSKYVDKFRELSVSGMILTDLSERLLQGMMGLQPNHASQIAAATKALVAESEH